MNMGDVRLASIVVLALLAGSVRAESENCEELPAARQAMCWMILSCAAIEDGTLRQECFQAAYDGFRAEMRSPVPAPRQPSIPPAPVAEPEQEAAVATAVVPRSETPEPERAQPAERASLVTERSVERLVYDVPDEFEAIITYHRDLVRDRQLFVLDDTLLFEGNALAEGRLRVGQQVDVTKVSSLLGDRFDVSGIGRTVEARRIPCEQENLSRDSTKKCSVLRPGG